VRERERERERERVSTTEGFREYSDDESHSSRRLADLPRANVPELTDEPWREWYRYSEEMPEAIDDADAACF
jgi:hypothetical protein